MGVFDNAYFDAPYFDLVEGGTGQTHSASLIETLLAAEGAVASLSTLATNLESLGTLEIVSSTGENAVNVSEILPPTDALGSVKSTSAGVSEMIAVVDNMGAAAAYVLAMLEAGAAADSSVAGLVAYAAMVEAGGSADSWSVFAGATLQASDTLNAYETMSQTIAYGGTLVEVLTTTDAALPQHAAVVGLLDSMSASDITAASYITSAAFNDSALLVEVSEAAWASFAFITEGLAAIAISDSENAIIVAPRQYGLAGVLQKYPAGMQTFPLEGRLQMYPLEDEDA